MKFEPSIKSLFIIFVVVAMLVIIHLQLKNDYRSEEILQRVSQTKDFIATLEMVEERN